MAKARFYTDNRGRIDVMAASADNVLNAIDQRLAKPAVSDVTKANTAGTAEWFDRDAWRYALTCSPFAATVVNANAEEFCSYLQQYGWQAPGLAEFERRLAGRMPSVGQDEIAEKCALRQFRNIELAMIAMRELLGYESNRSTLETLSALAECCIRSAHLAAEQRLQERFGVARDDTGAQQRMLIVGMGKLGGGELNFSSDIDLVFLYRTAGETDGRKCIDCQDYFRRLGQIVIDYLHDVTADGFVYRVDMRLRPFGSSGPLAISLDAMEAYLFTQARDWERYAWIKARVVSGDKVDANALQELLRPFIYRRYLDYAVFESLRDLKRQIGLKADQKGATDNIKLGPGGIREVEFIVQAFQLVRGGREPALQQHALAQVLPLLAQCGHLTEDDAARLWEGYAFLRRAENRLQMVDDRQTHLLPSEAAEQSRLALAMRLDSYAEFLAQLAKHQAFINQMFASVFAAADSSSGDDFREVWMQLRDDKVDLPSVQRQLECLQLVQSEAIAEQLQQFARSGRYQRYSNRAQDLLDRIIAAALADLADYRDNAALAFERLLKLLQAVAGRSGYLQLIADCDRTRQSLMKLVAESAWLAEFVTLHPMVLDELLDLQSHEVVAPQQEIIGALLAEMAQHEEADLGVQMDLARHFQHSRMMRIAAADMSGVLPVMKVSDALSWLAEGLLEVATQLVYARMTARHGRPGCTVDHIQIQPEFAIIAYGKLGGLELGYSSDLDIVFLHESSGSQQVSDGDKSLDNQVYFSRLAQKLVHFLATLTPAGVLYEIDTRLRPNGRSGVLVVGIDAFADYQQNEAWTWEHQALVRARVAVGSERLRARFEQIRCDILQRRDNTKLRTEVADMRERMRTELASKEAGKFDLKQGAGGIADIEFMVQYLVLENVSNDSAVLRHTDNVRQIECLQQLGYLSADVAAQLTAAYLHFRSRLHRLAMQLVDGHMVVDDAETQSHREQVVQCWQQIMT